jgi:hypothetical protein
MCLQRCHFEPRIQLGLQVLVKGEELQCGMNVQSW